MLVLRRAEKAKPNMAIPTRARIEDNHGNAAETLSDVGLLALAEASSRFLVWVSIKP